MAQRVTAIFPTREDAGRAADALVDQGADRSQISTLARGDEGKVATMPPAGEHHEGGVIEPARKVGDSGAPLTTSDAGETATGAVIGAVAGLAAGLLALTVPGIGLVLAAGPLAAAIVGGAVVGGVVGGLMDIGIEEHHARGYEKRIRGGGVLMTALVPDFDRERIRRILLDHKAEDITFTEDTSSLAQPAYPATGVVGGTVAAPSVGSVPNTSYEAPAASSAADQVQELYIEEEEVIHDRT